MKRNIQVSGTIELNEKDIKRILISYARGNEMLLLKAIDSYLTRENGISAKKITQQRNEKDELSIKVDVQTISEAGISALSISKLWKPTAVGFTKQNMGFYRELSKYFVGLKKKKKKRIAYEITLKHMRKFFPGLTERKFYNYIVDKRQWLRRGFSFDSDSRTFHF
jgi:hypothetical protein